jgi:hypothetical protein
MRRAPSLEQWGDTVAQLRCPGGIMRCDGLEDKHHTVIANILGDGTLLHLCLSALWSLLGAKSAQEVSRSMGGDYRLGTSI